MDANTLWTGAAISYVGIVLGFALNRAYDAFTAQRARRGHWLALRADIIRCGIGAKGYVEGGVQAPAGRLPFASYSTGYPALLMAGLLSESDIEAICRFFDNAVSFNSSLDLAQDAISAKSAISTEK